MIDIEDTQDEARELYDTVTSNGFVLFQAYLDRLKEEYIATMQNINLDQTNNKILAEFINCREGVNVIDRINAFTSDRKQLKN